MYRAKLRAEKLIHREVNCSLISPKLSNMCEGIILRHYNWSWGIAIGMADVDGEFFNQIKIFKNDFWLPDHRI